MPYLSTFWKKHYKDVGFCCTYQPLEESPIMNIPGYENKYVVSFIDLEWMSSKQMKWIGWDKFGYIVWSTPQGMLYGFSDLKRNEAGKKFEKDHGKLPFVNPGVPFGKPIDDGGIKLIGADDSFYEKELRILKDCGFCHDHKPMPTHEEKDGKEKEADLPANTDAWKDYASGNLPTNTEQVTDYSVPTWSGVPPQEEIPNYSSPAGGGAGGKDAAERDYMAPLPLAPLNDLPTDFTPTDLPAYIPTLPGQPTIPASKVVPSPATQQVAKMTLPSVIKPQAVNTKVTRNNSKQPSIPKIYGAPALPNSSNPPSVGTYGVTPTTMPQHRIKINNINYANFNKLAAIDNLRYDDQSKYLRKRIFEKEDEQKGIEIKDIALTLNSLLKKGDNEAAKEVAKTVEGADKIISYSNLMMTFEEYASAKREYDGAVANKIKDLRKFKKNLQTRQNAFFGAVSETLTGIISPEFDISFKIMKTLQEIVENDKQYLRSTMQMIHIELSDTTIARDYRIGLIKEMDRLNDKLKKIENQNKNHE